MKRTIYTSEFKEEAVKQVADKVYAVPNVVPRGCEGSCIGALLVVQEVLMSLLLPETSKRSKPRLPISRLISEARPTCTTY